MAKFKVEVEELDGYSRWVAPLMKGYKMACCDCGLVHDLDFQIVKVLKQNSDGTWEYGKPLNNHRVLFRAKRNKRSTGQIRRHKKK